MTDKQYPEQLDDKPLSLFDYIMIFIFTIFSEYSTYKIFLRAEKIVNCNGNTICNLSEWASPVVMPLMALGVFYLLVIKNQKLILWLIAQVIVLYFIFF